MLLLVLFAFLAGVVTVLSPCILPVLPLILSSGVSGTDRDRSRPLGVIVGFVASFTFFTLFLSALVRILGIPADALRVFSVVVMAGFGLSLVVPRFQTFLERLFSRLTGLAPDVPSRRDFGSGVILGLSLGLLWTPCVGPILASVIALALGGSVTPATFAITFAYALGTAVPLLAVMRGGRTLLHRVPWLLARAGRIQQAFGLLMILTAFAIFTGLDRKFQTFVLNAFPRYGTGLTALEDRGFIRAELGKLNGSGAPDSVANGQPSFTLQPKGVPAPEIIPGGAWINSPPLTLAGLRGKVVVLDFWTYSCINCQRTLPYLRDWYATYAAKGLVIIGVHAPEFEFEKSEANVRRAVDDFHLPYPVVQDNDFATWRAYGNHYWPAKYFIDQDGNIRYTHFGEGGYDESERVIQALLAEAGATGVSGPVSSAPADANFAGTPETYLGSARIRNFASPERLVPDAVSNYSAPVVLPRDGFAYAGRWTVTGEHADPHPGAVLTLDFTAKEVYLVMRPQAGTVRVRVTVDGIPQYFGSDVMEGSVTVDADRLYRLVSLPTPGRHILQLEFPDDHAELYAFTFG